MTQELAVLILGLLASAGLIIAGLTTQRKHLLPIMIAVSVINLAQYSILTGAIFALFAAGMGGIRNSLAYLSLNDRPKLNSPFVHIGFAILYIGMFIILADWSNFQPVVILPLIGSLFAILATFFTKMYLTKIMYIGASGLWLVYEYANGLYGAMVGEAFTIVANVITLVVLLKAQKAGIPQEKVEDLYTSAIKTVTTSLPVITTSIKTVTNSIQPITTSIKTVTNSIQPITTSIKTVSTKTKQLPVIQ